MVVGVAGLGLIGGSLAKALKALTPHRVLGEDASEEVLGAALRDGAADARLSPERLGDCDLVVVALYPAQAVDYIRGHAAAFRKGGVVMDCCGVKRGVCRAADETADRHGFHFIGAHPMAGVERSGYAASRASLFKGASLILTPAEGVPASAVRLVTGLAEELGFGKIRFSTPERHDEMIAYTSQLAHAVSCAYVSSPLSGASDGFCAGSFSDMTRVARLNEAMWTELFLDNGDCLCREIDGLRARLGALSSAIRAGDREGLKRLLREGRELKERIDGE